MASPIIHHPSQQYEPQGRFTHCSAIISGKQYTYGGNFGAGGSPPLSTVEIFDLVTEQWQQMPTTGEAPTGHMGALCAAVGTYIYHFGGRDGSNYYNSIHCLEISKLMWIAVPLANNQETPMLKSGAGMIVYSNNLIVAGGYGLLPEISDPEKYVPDPEYEGQGWTNEVHCFHVDSSELC